MKSFISKWPQSFTWNWNANEAQNKQKKETNKECNGKQWNRKQLGIQMKIKAVSWRR